MDYSYGGLTQGEYEAMQAEELRHQEQNAIAQKKILRQWFYDYCPTYGVERYLIPGIGVQDVYEIQQMGWTYWEG